MRVIAVLVLLALTVPAARPSAAAGSPNVVLVITDDQGYGDLASTGNPHLKTPQLDRLAAESVVFDRFFVSPVCAPTRASLLTGRYHLRTGTWGVTGGRETMRGSEVTLAEILRRAGYRTGAFGKWHNGAHVPATPRSQGFDEFFGFRGGHWNLYFDSELEHDGRPAKTSGYIADVITDRAVDFIERHRREPFFVYLALNTLHSPLQVPDAYFDRFTARGLDAKLASVYGMVENIDDNMGRLLARIDRLGLRDDTIVIFLSDNGPAGDRYNAGMRGRKGSVHEGGGRVPFFLRWPARLQPARVDRIAAHVDLLPTLADLIGLPAPHGVALDGRSLRPLLEGRHAEWDDRLLFTHQARRDGISPYPGAVRTQRYRLTNEGPGWQLFDMEADPAQRTDVAPAHPDLAGRLAAAYDRWFAEVSAGAFVFPAIELGHAAEDPIVLDAPEARLSGGLAFKNSVPGYANDWIAGWTGTDGTAAWEIDVVRAGRYEVELAYVCDEADAGSRIRVSAGGRPVEAVVAPAPARPVHLPHRDSDQYYRSIVWSRLPVGVLRLARGRARLEVTVLSRPGRTVMELKHVSLRHAGP